jgi:hypothetical protein
MPAQVLRANPATVSVQFVDTSGTAANPGTVTATVTNLAGETVATPSVSGSGTGARSITLTSADTADLDTLTVTFDSSDASIANVTETVEVVGALLFTETEARAFDGGAMAGATYTDAMIDEARARITDQFETICGVSFVPRYRLDTFSGDGGGYLLMDRMKVTSIRSVEARSSGAATWTAFDADELADLYIEPWGELLRESRGTFLSGRRNIRIGYEHGFTTPPYDVKRAALMTLAYELKKSQVDPRAISISDEMTTTQLWTPGISARGAAIHPLPEVDRILKLHMHQTPVVA